MRVAVRLFACLALVAASPAADTAPEPAPEPPKGGAATAAARPVVLIETSLGDIRVELFADEAPKTVANFLALASGDKEWLDPQSGKQVKRPFYDGLVFHRVIDGFMIQGGCPLGNGRGGPGFSFEDEIDAVALGLDGERLIAEDGSIHPSAAYMQRDIVARVVLPRMKALGAGETTAEPERRAAYEKVMDGVMKMSLKDLYEAIGYRYDDALPGAHQPLRGCIAMANSGPNTNGSQFFINLADTPHLAGKHTVFGRVVAGMEVVDAIGKVPTGAMDKPEKDVVIERIRLVEDAEPDADADADTEGAAPAEEAGE